MFEVLMTFFNLGILSWFLDALSSLLMYNLYPASSKVKFKLSLLSETNRVYTLYYTPNWSRSPPFTIEPPIATRRLPFTTNPFLGL